MYAKLEEQVAVVKSLVESLERDLAVAKTGKKNIRLNIKKTCKELKNTAWAVRDEILNIEKSESEARKSAPVAE
jgi:hypothetical protein